MTRSLLAVLPLFAASTLLGAYGKAVEVTTNKAGTINYSNEVNFAARNGKPRVTLASRKKRIVTKSHLHKSPNIKKSPSLLVAPKTP